jgi:hypothetical protein
MTASPLQADINRASRHVSFVPYAEVAEMLRAYQKKSKCGERRRRNPTCVSKRLMKSRSRPKSHADTLSFPQLAPLRDDDLIADRINEAVAVLVPPSGVRIALTERRILSVPSGRLAG